jgi:hypothetical protein
MEEKIYNFLKTKRTEHKLYIDLIEFVKEEKNKTEKECNSIFYNVLVKLENSINNAGHENRRSNDISYIWEQKKRLFENSTLKDENE